MKKAAIILAALSIGTLGCITASAKEEDSWFKVNEAADAIEITLPNENGNQKWNLVWLNGENVFSSSEGDLIENSTETLKATGESGYSTVILFDEESQEFKGLTAFVNEGGQITECMEGFGETLPIIDPLNLTHCSGVGAWFTDMIVHSDGTFTGSFHDSEMGETGEDYPDGTVYVSEFSGKFGKIFPAGNNMIGMVLENISMREPGNEWIEDGMRFVSAEPAGLSGSVYFMCEPTTPVDAMNQEALFWKIDNPKTEGTLNCYAIYEAGSGDAFYSAEQ